MMPSRLATSAAAAVSLDIGLLVLLNTASCCAQLQFVANVPGRHRRYQDPRSCTVMAEYAPPTSWLHFVMRRRYGPICSALSLLRLHGSFVARAAATDYAAVEFRDRLSRPRGPVD